MKRKWIIWVSIILVILCVISIVAGGVVVLPPHQPTQKGCCSGACACCRGLLSC